MLTPAFSPVVNHLLSSLFQGHERSAGVIPESQAAQDAYTRDQPQPAGSRSTLDIDPLQAEHEQRTAEEAETSGRVQAELSGVTCAAQNADLNSCKRSHCCAPEASSRDHARGCGPLSENSLAAKPGH